VLYRISEGVCHFVMTTDVSLLTLSYCSDIYLHIYDLELVFSTIMTAFSKRRAFITSHRRCNLY
jgi:hypothetical protein